MFGKRVLAWTAYRKRIFRWYDNSQSVHWDKENFDFVHQYGEEKLTFEEADDISIIPNPFVEPIVVYGACMRLKGNPKHARFSYWLSMYKDAFANLKSKVSKTIEEHPTIKISRR